MCDQFFLFILQVLWCCCFHHQRRLRHCGTFSRDYFKMRHYSHYSFTTLVLLLLHSGKKTQFNLSVIFRLTTHVQLTLATTTSQALEIFLVNFTLATIATTALLESKVSDIILEESLAPLALLTLWIFLEESNDTYCLLLPNLT